MFVKSVPPSAHCAVPRRPSFNSTASPSMNSRLTRIRWRSGALPALAMFALAATVLAVSGCGVTAMTQTSGALVISTTTIDFGSVAVGQTGTANVTVKNTGTSAVAISQIAASGQEFSVQGPGGGPVSIPGGATLDLTVDFAPTAAGADTGTITLQTEDGTFTIAVTGDGQTAAAPLGSLTCSTGSLTGAGTDACTITLTSAAGSGGVAVALSSNNAAVTVPSSVTVAQGSSTVGFTAQVSAVAQAQTAVLTARAGGASKSYSIQLGASGATQAPSGTLRSLTCNTGSLTGAGTDACTVTLTSAAGSGGLAVALSSNDTAVTIPSSVTVPQGSSTVGFTAKISAVVQAQTAVLTATAGGTSTSYSIQLGASVAALSLSASTLDFGTVTIGSSPAIKSIVVTSSGTSALTITAASITGAGFSIAGPAFPLTLNPGQTATLSVQFNPTTTGTFTGSITLNTNAPTGSATIALSGAAQAAPGALRSLTCSKSSLTGAGTDTCTVALTAPAGSGGLAVALSSTSSAVAVPSSVSVPQGSSSADFTATVSAVTTAQTAVLTASAGGVSKSYSINLGASGPGLTLQSTSVAFGTVTLNTKSTQTVTLTATGTSALTISAATATGTGFSIIGPTLPVTLNPGQTTTLSLQFDPTTAGSFTGAVTLTTNTSAGSATIALSGTGQATTYQVALSWSAPSNSTDPVSGYDVYRAISGSSSYQLLNPTPNTSTSYIDTTVQATTSYTYYVVSVDSSGTQSKPSNTASATIP